MKMIYEIPFLKERANYIFVIETRIIIYLQSIIYHIMLLLYRSIDTYTYTHTNTHEMCHAIAFEIRKYVGNMHLSYAHCVRQIRKYNY